MERQQKYQKTAASIASPTVDLRLQYKTRTKKDCNIRQHKKITAPKDNRSSFSTEDKESKQSYHPARTVE
jgi:hypothetical protein